MSLNSYSGKNSNRMIVELMCRKVMGQMAAAANGENVNIKVVSCSLSMSTFENHYHEINSSHC